MFKSHKVDILGRFRAQWSKNPVLFCEHNPQLFLYLYLDRLVEVREKDWMGSVSSSLIRSDIEPSSDRSNSRSWWRELSSPALECPEERYGEPEPPKIIRITLSFTKTKKIDVARKNPQFKTEIHEFDKKKRNLTFPL